VRCCDRRASVCFERSLSAISHYFRDISAKLPLISCKRVCFIALNLLYLKGVTNLENKIGVRIEHRQMLKNFTFHHFFKALHLGYLN
jgi:hypothetical protein